MNNKHFTLLLLPAFFLLFSFTHEYHVSIYEAEYKAEKRSMEIAIQLFTDDLERALKEEGSVVNLDQEEKTDQLNLTLARYIDSHFHLFLGDNQLKLNFVGKEWEDHHTLWCYVEIKELDAPGELRVVNTVFTALFQGQQNIHHFSVNGVKKSITLTRDVKEATVQFDDKKAPGNR